MLKIVILGSGKMLTNLIAGCMDTNQQIVGVFRAELLKRTKIEKFLIDLFNPSSEYNYIKSHKIYEIKAKSANSAEFKKEILRLNTDIVIVGTWGEKIKKSIIDLPKIATINVHPALLPKYRGPNPYLQAIKYLEKESGVTFHLMDENYDTGPILLQKKVPIEKNDTGKELKEKIAIQCRKAIAELLKELEREIIIPVAQDENKASYFKHIEEKDVMLDFSMSAEDVAAHIRAFHPWYKCYFAYNNHFFIPNAYKLQVVEGDERYHLLSAGQVIEKCHKEKSITVLCGDKKLLKMTGLNLYGGFNKIFTGIYIKTRVKKFENISD